MSQLDKFKRRLIRSVARLRVEEKKPDAEVWEILGKEMGCDCGPLWDRMRALTVKKLGRLLACEDRTEVIAKVARPSNTDMLMFDLVLAHEDDVDVIGRDLMLEKATDYKALQELLELVQKFSLEETDTASLPHTWAEAACYYESKGTRLTSPMLLQRRWYQFKELTRANFYKLWHIYRGHTSRWDKARTECSLTDLQVAVAERYPFLITKPFQKWDQLIEAGRIVLPHHFTRADLEKSDSGTSGNEQDLVLLEPEVETINLDEDSDSETKRDSRQRHSTVQPKIKKLLKRTNEDNTVTVVHNKPEITIKTEPVDSDGLCNVKILEITNKPVEPLDDSRQEIIKIENIDPRIALKNDLLRNISQCIESTEELIKQCDPQEAQTKNVLNALNDVENQMKNLIKPPLSVEVIEHALEPQIRKHNTDENIHGKAVDNIRNKIVEEMSKASKYDPTENTVKGRVKTEDELSKSNAPEGNIENSLNSEKLNTADDVRSSAEGKEELENIIKKNADDFINKSKQSREEFGAMALTDFTVVDSGIDFVDDGIEYREDDEDKKMDIDVVKSSSTGAEIKDGIMSSIDLTLMNTSVIVTTMLDDMLHFKDKTFESVVGKSTIDFAELESKPKQTVKEPVNVLQVKQENKSEEPVAKFQVDEENKSNADDSNNDTSDSENVISDDQRIKPTSYLLQKPKSRSYNPIQLCKNPDFNTRLKRLTFGFLSSERNRQFLSACKPATVDLHKAFEHNLVNGTLYLKRTVTTDIVKEISVHKDDQTARTASVVPSAMCAQTLIDRSKMTFQPPSKVSSIDLTCNLMNERNKVIHLPDITQVRRINQKLLTAEVPPTRMQNNVTSEKIPSYSGVRPVVESTVVMTEDTAGLGDTTFNDKRTKQVINTKTSPLLSNLLVTHKPSSFPNGYVNLNAHLVTEKSSPAWKESTTKKVPEKRMGRPPTNPDKCRKPQKKPIYPYVSWSKPVVKNILPLDEFLLKHDTLLKILARAKNLPDFTYSIGNKNTVNEYQNSQKCVKKTKVTKRKQKLSDTQKSRQLDTNKIEVTEDQKDKITKGKQRVRAKKGIMKTICCWARAWVFKSKGKLLRLPKHICPFPECNCCCKDELPLSKSKEIVENIDPIKLSYNESLTNLTSISKTIECVVKKFAPKQLVVDGTRPFITHTTIVTQGNEQLIHLKASEVSSDNPIFLGRNKILLTTAKLPLDAESPKKESVAPKVVPSFPLPDGVEIVLQANGELGCMVKPGVELDSTQISVLPSILEAVTQQTDIQQPFVLSDVINLCGDENEQNNDKDENIRQANKKKALLTSIEQSRNGETAPGKQLVEETVKAEIYETECNENRQEIAFEGELLIQQKHVTAVSKVCNIISERLTEENDREKSNQKGTNTCQMQDRDTLKSRMCDNNFAKSDENRDDHQTCIEKDTTYQSGLYQKIEINKCGEDKLIDNINYSKDTEAKKQETQETDKPSAGSRNLLSDLMAMSGISEEDMKMAPEVSRPTLPAVMNIDLVNFANKMNADGSVINQFTDLTPVTSIAQLKYACEQDSKFFKLDFDTSTLVSISVCIEKKEFTDHKLQTDTIEFVVKETGAGDKVGIPFNTKVGIPTNHNAGIPATSSTSVEGKKSISVRKFGRNKKTPVFTKPITILRHTRPRRSLLRNQIECKRKKFKRPRKATGERIESDDDSMAGISKVPRDRITYRRLAANNTVTEISDDSSDDEPLALKSKRMKLDMSVPAQMVMQTVKNLNEGHEENVQEFLRSRLQNVVNVIVQRESRRPEEELTNTDSMELDTDMPTAAILEESVPDLEEGVPFESESSPEDSILGM